MHAAASQDRQLGAETFPQPANAIQSRLPGRGAEGDSLGRRCHRTGEQNPNGSGGKYLLNFTFHPLRLIGIQAHEQWLMESSGIEGLFHEMHAIAINSEEACPSSRQVGAESDDLLNRLA
jgi:hypothetical protein